MPFGEIGAVGAAFELGAPLARRALMAARGAAWISIAVALLALGGWVLHLAPVTAIVPGWATMAPNTALCFVLSGIALLLLCPPPGSVPSHRLALASGAVVFAVALLTLSQDLVQLDFGLDQWMFPGALAASGGQHPGRMSPVATAGLLCLGASLALLAAGTRAAVWTAQLLAGFAFLLGLGAMLGYINSVERWRQSAAYSSMALHTSILLAVLGVGVLNARPMAGAMAAVMSEFDGGIMARRLLPLSLVAAFALDWLRIHGLPSSSYAGEAGFALFTCVNVGAFAVLFWWSARSLNRVDDERRRERSALARSTAELDDAAKRLESEVAGHRRAERQIAESLREIGDLKAALDEHAIVAITNPQGKITYVNDKFCAISKYSREELLGQDHRIINSGHHAKEFFRGMWASIGRGRVWKAEIKNRAKDGSIYWVDTTIVPFLDEAGRPAQYVAITNPQGKITYVNDKFCAISKYSREDLLGQDHRIINSGFHSKEFFHHLWRSIAHGSVWKGEIRNRAKDGSIYWVDTTIVPFLNDKGKPARYVAIRADITERKRAEEALLRGSQELARSNADLEQFAYVASHDLQEPLRGVAGCVQLLAQRYAGKLDERADEFIRHAVVNVERMQQLIHALLDYSRVDRKGGFFEKVDCQLVFHEALANLSAAIEESGAVVTSDPLPAIRGDRTHLGQLFMNLIGNAVKFRGHEPPRIHVRAERQDGEGWKFAVRDNGIGIDPSHAGRIFGVFQRLNTRKKYPGTGIGLALCKRIVERHEGRIWVESEPDRGSTFVFTIGDLKQERE